MLRPTSCADDEEEKQVFMSVDYWSNLPEDLHVDILCRLPDKPLITLKCVSRYWYILISNHCAPRMSLTTFYGLIYTRENQSTSRNTLSFSRGVYFRGHQCPHRLLRSFQGYLDTFMPFKLQLQEFQDCCNGLVLIARFTSCPDPTQYYVCNPTTREWVLIPLNPNHINEKQTHVASLLYDPSNPCSPNAFMISAPKENSQCSLKFDIFSSVLGNWSSQVIPLDPNLDGFDFIGRSVYLNGMLYKLSMAKYLLNIRLVQEEKEIKVIFSRTFELPGKDEFSCCGSFGASRGSFYYSNYDYYKIKVWLFKDGAEWSLQHTINIDELVAHPRAYLLFREERKLGQIKVFGFHPCLEEVIVGNTTLIHGYNAKTKELKRYGFLDMPILRGEYEVFPLMRCAVTLNSIIKNFG